MNGSGNLQRLLLFSLLILTWLFIVGGLLAILGRLGFI